MTYNVLNSSLANAFVECDSKIRLEKLKKFLLNVLTTDHTVFCLQEVSKSWSNDLRSFFSGKNYTYTFLEYDNYDGIMVMAFPNDKYKLLETQNLKSNGLLMLKLTDHTGKEHIKNDNFVVGCYCASSEDDIKKRLYEIVNKTKLFAGDLPYYLGGDFILTPKDEIILNLKDNLGCSSALKFNDENITTYFKSSGKLFKEQIDYIFYDSKKSYLSTSDVTRSTRYKQKFLFMESNIYNGIAPCEFEISNHFPVRGCFSQ